MELKCYINGVEYSSNLVQGLSFTEEYNETLDSGTIIINGINKLEDLKPYDDVFIYEGDFKGYGNNIKYDGFYKHLLVDQFSETKKLETIQLPNVSITQP